MLPSKMLKSQEKKSTFSGNMFNKIVIFPKRHRLLEKKGDIFSDFGGSSCHFDYMFKSNINAMNQIFTTSF